MADFAAYVISIITTIVDVVGGIFGIITYRANQTLKCQEIIFPLRQFDENKKIYYTKELIDNIPIQLVHNNEIIANIPIKLANTCCSIIPSENDKMQRLHLKRC
jgi:hypothetical protein